MLERACEATRESSGSLKSLANDWILSTLDDGVKRGTGGSRWRES